MGHCRKSRQGERDGGEDWRRNSRQVESDLSARVRELEAHNGELRVARDLLAVNALHDPLTGLLVRSVFIQHLSHALSRLSRHQHSVGVLFIDLDRLKHINDTYGHAAGDRLLRCCGERLRAGVRPSDAVARVGGDEFVVLLDDLPDGTEAEAVAQRVLGSLNTDCDIGAGPLVPTTASVGVAVADSLSMTAETLVAHADAAMYRAKQSGRARYELFDEAAYTAAGARQRLEIELRSALAGDQLLLHYQPIIDLTTGGTHAVEALLRWQHPGSGLLPAADFIALAEDTGLILELGPWVLAEACRQLARWDASLGDRAPQRLFINLSVAELAQPQLAQQLAATAAAVGINPDRLVLEITETGALHEPGDGGTLEGLLRLGCELAIDDFGTGYSSLSRLARLPAGILKIDRSFVRDLHSGPEAAAVVSAVLLLAHNLRKTVVAEGVEDARTLTVLRDLGCEYAQGYHLARPQHGDTLSERMSRADPLALHR